MKLFPVPNSIPVHVLTPVSIPVRSLVMFCPPFLLMSLSLFLFLLWYILLSLSVSLFLFRRQIPVSGCFIFPHCFPIRSKYIFFICLFLLSSFYFLFMRLLILLFCPQLFCVLLPVSVLFLFLFLVYDFFPVLVFLFVDIFRFDHVLSPFDISACVYNIVHVPVHSFPPAPVSVMLVLISHIPFLFQLRFVLPDFVAVLSYCSCWCFCVC